MKKIVKEYIDKYGDISRDDDTRFSQMLLSVKIPKKSRKTIISKMREILNIKWNRIDFVIYLVPKGTPRPRHNLRANTFYVMGAKDNKDIFTNFFNKHDIETIYTGCKFECRSYLPIPSDMSSVEKILAEMGLIRPLVTPDWDNLGKTYSDMIQDTLIFNDSCIIEGTSKKYYSTKPRVEISIEYMDKYDSEYNFKKIRKKVERT